MSEVDLITSIQKEDEEEEGGIVTTIISALNYIGTFLTTIGFLQTGSSNELISMNGWIVMFFGICSSLIGWYGPEMLAVFHAKDKKYIKNITYYGSRRKERTMEILDDVLVIRKKEEDPEKADFTKILDDTPFEEAIRAVGVNFLSDKEVDKKIEMALKERYERLKTKVETDAERTTVDRIRDWLIGLIQKEDSIDNAENKEKKRLAKEEKAAEKAENKEKKRLAKEIKWSEK